MTLESRIDLTEDLNAFCDWVHMLKINAEVTLRNQPPNADPKTRKVGF